MTIFDRAVASVIARGFHTTEPSNHIANRWLMAQFVRLVEEVGEWEESQGVSELADVVIVCAQIAYLLGLELYEDVFIFAPATDGNLPALLGALARGLRKNDATMIATALSCLIGEAVGAAKARKIYDLRLVIMAKLNADEKRGFLHGEKVCA